MFWRNRGEAPAWGATPPRESKYSRIANPTEMGKMVTSLVALIFFNILSKFNLLKVSRPVEIRMMSLCPGMLSMRSMVS